MEKKLLKAGSPGISRSNQRAISEHIPNTCSTLKSPIQRAPSDRFYNCEIAAAVKLSEYGLLVDSHEVYANNSLTISFNKFPSTSCLCSPMIALLVKYDSRKEANVSKTRCSMQLETSTITYPITFPISPGPEALTFCIASFAHTIV